MKKNLLFLMLVYSNLLFAQTFQEICPSSITNGTIVDFERYNDTVYATGFFSQICGTAAIHLAKWDGNTWIPAEKNLTAPGHALRSIGDDLYIAQYKESIDSNWVYILNDSGLNTLGQGVYLTTASGFSQLPNIFDIVEYNGQLIACGEFDRVGNQSISGIMQWDGNHWTVVGGGLSGNILNTAPVMYPHQMLVYDSMLYVVGNFRNAGGIEVNGVARWNGSNWEPLGDGFNSTVYGIGVFQGEVYVGGDFTASGTTPLKRIAKWDGLQWLSPGFGFVPANSNDYAFVHTITVINNELMISGGLKKIEFDDNTTANCGGIVKFDGTNLYTFNGGVANNDIEAVIQYGNDLMIGGGVFGNGYTGNLDLTTPTFQSRLPEPFQIYPNPATSQIHIPQNIDFSHTNLINFNGRSQELFLNENSRTIDISRLEKGLYILRITGRDATYLAKFVKQ